MMKQHITQEQFNELSPAHAAYVKLWQAGSTLLPTIGQMIAFIDEHTQGMGWWNIERAGGKRAWRLQSKYGDFDDDGKQELCDALWDGVKLLLEIVTTP